MMKNEGPIDCTIQKNHRIEAGIKQTITDDLYHHQLNRKNINLFPPFHKINKRLLQITRSISNCIRTKLRKLITSSEATNNCHPP